MQKDCVVQCENLFPVFVSDLGPDPDEVLDDTTMREVIKAVGYVMDADCEPT